MSDSPTMLMNDQINAESFLLEKNKIQPILEENDAECQIKPAGLIRIMTESEPSSHNRIILTKKASIIGRGDECDFQIPSVEISRRHCMIENKNSRWYITNLNSTNGLFINGTKIPYKAVLYDNYIISFGPLSRTMYRYVFYENYDPCNAIIKDVGLNDPSKSLEEYPSSLSSGNSENSAEVEDLTKKLSELKQAIRELSKSVEKYDSEVKYSKNKCEKIENDVQKTTELWNLINAKIKENLGNDFKNADLNTLSSFDKLKKLLLTELSCSICCEIILEPLILKCQHTFCSTCIRRWIKSSRQCPICREYIPYSFKNLGQGSLMFNGVVKIIVEYFLNDEELKERQKIIETKKNQIESMSDAESEMNLSFIPISGDERIRELFNNLFDINFSDLQNYSAAGYIAVDDDDLGEEFAEDFGEENDEDSDTSIDSVDHGNEDNQPDRSLESPQLSSRQRLLFRSVYSETSPGNQQTSGRPVLNRSVSHATPPYNLRNRPSRFQ